MTLYPFVDAKSFILEPRFRDKPIFTYATLDMNPSESIFFTPLYMGGAGLDLMVTIGLPLYHQNKFLGITELDLTVKNQSKNLKIFDRLKNKSLLVNIENEIIAANNIDKINSQKIIKAENILPKDISHLKDTQDTVSRIGSNYVYSQQFENAPWRLIYYKNIFEVYLASFINIIPIFALMLFLFYINKMYQQKETLHKVIQEQAIHDYMTGSYNRRYFFESGDAIFLKNKRAKNNITVVMIDIDNFKKVNDTYGHDIGDIAIKEIPRILNKNLRKSDLLARFGGE